MRGRETRVIDSERNTKLEAIEKCSVSKKFSRLERTNNKLESTKKDKTEYFSIGQKSKGIKWRGVHYAVECDDIKGRIR